MKSCTCETSVFVDYLVSDLESKLALFRGKSNTGIETFSARSKDSS